MSAEIKENKGGERGEGNGSARSARDGDAHESVPLVFSRSVDKLTLSYWNGADVSFNCRTSGPRRIIFPFVIGIADNHRAFFLLIGLDNPGC